VGTPENHLIELLPRKARLRLLSICEPVHLVMSQVLCEPGMPTRHAYFPIDGFISLIAPGAGHPMLEVGMIGREGMLGAQLVLGVETAPLRALVQGTGVARRIESRAFRQELMRSPALQRNLGRYIYVLMSQLATSATCLRFHPIRQRLARWLLMSQDRAHSDSFAVTQEFLAHMLGVRRAGITHAAGDLQRGGLIAYHRGHVRVLDRNGLEAAACDCYAMERDAHAALLQ